MCGCPFSCPGARTLGPAWRLVATALLLATPATCLGRNRSVSSPSFGSHKTANPRTLSCATRRRERCTLFGGCLLHGVCCHERRGPRPPPTNRRRAVLPTRPTSLSTATEYAATNKSTSTILLLLRQQPLRRPVPRVVDGVVARVHDEVGHGPVARARVARVQDAVVEGEERPARHARRDQFEVWR